MSNIAPRPCRNQGERTLSHRHLEAERLYNSGEGYSAIARRFGVSTGSVQRMIEKCENVRAFERVRRQG